MVQAIFESSYRSLPSARLIEHLRDVPHTSRYEPSDVEMPRYLAFYGAAPGIRGLVGLIDYATEPARAYQVVDGQQVEIKP